MLTRKEQAALAKKNIIEATEKLIREKDYDSLRIADIVSACGMTPGNFYHYFKSKEELFEEIDTNKFYSVLKVFEDNAATPILIRVESYILQWIDLMINYYGPNYSYNWVRHYVHKPLLSDKSNKINLIYNHIEGFLKKGVENKELCKNTPVECIAYSVAFTILGCSAFFGMNGDKDTVNRWVRTYCDVYIRDLLAPYCVPRSDLPQGTETK